LSPYNLIAFISILSHAMSTPIEADSLRERELSKLDTAGSVVMTKELFEKLYLQPETRVAGRLRKTFGNPTPLYCCHQIKTFGASANTAIA
jgi:hypothetical protein